MNAREKESERERERKREREKERERVRGYFHTRFWKALVYLGFMCCNHVHDPKHVLLQGVIGDLFTMIISLYNFYLY